MPALKSLTETKIEKACGDVIFERALEYVCTSALRNRLIYPQAKKLTGIIEGNYGDYRISFQLLQDGDLRTSCSCPAEMFFCKHAAALAITYLREPETFLDMNSLPGVLEQKSKKELQDLVTKMIVKHPDCLVFLGIPGFEEDDEDEEYRDEWDE